MQSKTFLLFILALMLMPAKAELQPVAAELHALSSKSLMLDVYSIANKRLVAVGERGHILVSDDGQQWQQQESPVNSTLTKVFFINEQLGWAVGHDSAIIHTNDGGTTWQLQNYQPSKERPFLDLYFSDESNGVAVGAYGLFYRTNDGGKSWKQEYHLELLNEDDRLYLEETKEYDPEIYEEEIASILPHFNRIMSLGDVWYLVGELGMMATSADQGKTWLLMDEIYFGSFFDINAITNTNLLVAGLRGNLFYSGDSGTSWQEIETDTIALMNDIVVNDDGSVVVLANSGVILKSNNGTSFTTQVEEDGKALIAGVWFNNKLIVASEVGMKVVELQ